MNLRSTTRSNFPRFRTSSSFSSRRDFGSWKSSFWFQQQRSFTTNDNNKTPPTNQDDELANLLTMVLNLKASPRPPPKSPQKEFKPRQREPMKPLIPSTPISVATATVEPIPKLDSNIKLQQKEPSTAEISLDKLLASMMNVTAPSEKVKEPLKQGEKGEDELLDELLSSEIAIPPPSSKVPRKQPRFLQRKVTTGGYPRKKAEGQSTKDLDYFGDMEREPGKREKEEFGFETGNRSRSESLAELLDQMKQDTQFYIKTWTDDFKLEVETLKKVMETQRKKLVKRWKFLAKVRKLRQQAKREKGTNKKDKLPGAIHPQFTEGFGLHFAGLFEKKKIRSDHKLRPMMDLYARKLAQNGRLTYKQKYKAMAFVLKYLNKPVPDDYVPGGDYRKPFGTESMPFHILMAHKKQLRRAEIEAEILKRGGTIPLEEEEAKMPDDIMSLMESKVEEVEEAEEEVEEDEEFVAQAKSRLTPLRGKKTTGTITARRRAEKKESS